MKLKKKNISVVDEQWKKAAMLDDSVVAELLLHLHSHSHPPPPPPPLSVEWKVRQRRSKTLTVNAVKSPFPRASPTTPLSWSGGTSVSAGALDAASEDSSKKTQTSRSKVTSEATTGKRPRKKKTLAELKAAELALEDEKKQLIAEVKRAHANLDRERSSNEKLKLLKLELESETANSAGDPSSSNQVTKSSKIVKSVSSHSDPPAATMPIMGLIDTSPKPCLSFYIPDLNLPLEDDCNMEVQCEAS